MIDSDIIITKAEELLHRMSPEGRERARRARERKAARARRVMKRMFWAVLAVVAAAAIWAAVVGPIGMGGVMLVVVAMILAIAGSVAFSEERAVEPAALREVDLVRLPAQTERWLERQRPALPAPAQRLTDQIGVRLEQLMPQLQGLDPREPAAQEVRRLVADELPELVNGYQRVPKSMRRDAGDGISPDRQLVDGLGVVDQELKRMCEQLAAGDLDKLATQGRYLQLKYKGDPLG